MAKVTALKKTSGYVKNIETIKNCRVTNIKIPSTILQAVRVFVKNNGSTLNQFWKEAATYRLQVDEIKAAKEELDRILRQIAHAEEKLKDIEDREKSIAERENRLDELEHAQDICLEERKKEFEQITGKFEEKYQARLAELKEKGHKQQEEYTQLTAIDNEVIEETMNIGAIRSCNFRKKNGISLNVKYRLRCATRSPPKKISGKPCMTLCLN